MMILSSAPKRKQRQSVLIILLSLFAIVRLRQEDPGFGAMNSSDALGVVDEDPGLGAMNSSDKNNEVVIVVDGAPTPAAAAVGSHNSSTSTSTFRLPSSEWIDDIDTNYTLGCGAFKCAFPSRTTKRGDDDANSSSSSSSNRPDPDRGRYGYLVSGSNHYLKTAERTFALAQNLSVQFSVKHTLAANPIQLTSSSGNFVVQPIKLYSESSCLSKCKDRWYNTKRWADTLQVHSALVDPILFQERLRYDHKKTMRMMMSNSTHSKCLAQDFQLAIDPITGSILQIDLDRCWRCHHREHPSDQPLPPICSWTEKNIDVADCMQQLESIIERLIARKNYLYYNSTTTIDDDDDHQNTTQKSKPRIETKNQRERKKKPIKMIEEYKRERERKRKEEESIQ